MTKTRRQMAEYIKQVDAVCEVVDARIPQVSRNPDMDEIAAGKPRMMILNRIDLADPNMTAVWAKHFREQGMAVIQTDSRSGNGTQAFSGAVRTLLADKIAQWNEKGRQVRPCDGRRHSECGQIHVHQPHSRQKIRQGSGSSGRDARQPVVPRGERH